MDNESPDTVDPVESDEALAVVPQESEVPQKYLSDDYIDFNSMELVHPDDLEPGDARAESKYLQFIQPRLEYVLAMRREKLTYTQVAHNLGVSLKVLKNCAKRFPELEKVLVVGYQDAISQIKNTAYKMAMGFTESIQRCKADKNGNIKQYTDNLFFPPNADILKFILMTQAEGWNPKQEVHHTGEFTLGRMLQEINEENKKEQEKELPPPKIN